MEQQLEECRGQCSLCFIKGQNSRHSIEDCIQDGAQDIRENWKEIQTLMKENHWFALYSCCYDCHVPQAICQKWAQKKEQGRWDWLKGVDCQFKGIIMPMVITAIWEGEDWMVEMIMNWIKESRVEVGDQEQMCWWLGQKVEWGGIEVTRLIQVFYRIVRGMQSR